ncbi:3787_t:CDS:2 [Acaulospora morrowiae]|uniref:3787_t:CDS:1 n=1 Tax=Acaulospora morrowiae TaxID=94023 RepID=A0A9N9CG24_9GLOM|nr:3787_t:CDS:2 [Acaulospora morrowiae]
MSSDSNKPHNIILLTLLSFFFPPFGVIALKGCGSQLCLNIFLTIFGYIPEISLKKFKLPIGTTPGNTAGDKQVNKRSDNTHKSNGTDSKTDSETDNSNGKKSIFQNIRAAIKLPLEKIQS